MTETATVRVLSAVLETDGSIEVDLAVPGFDEPQTMTIESSKATRRLLVTDRRAIDLEIGDETDALVRRLINERLRLIEQEIARQQARQSPSKGKSSRVATVA